MRKAKLALDYRSLITLIKAIKLARRPLERRNTGTSALEGHTLLQIQEQLEEALKVVVRPAVERTKAARIEKRPRSGE